MTTLDNDQAMRSVDLTQQIAQRLTCGFDISVEDRMEAEELGVDIHAIAEHVGACYEQSEVE